MLLSINQTPDDLEIFDEEKVFDEQMVPLLRELMRIARAHKIPILVSTVFSVNEEGSGRSFACAFPKPENGKTRVPDNLRIAAMLLDGREGAEDVVDLRDDVDSTRH